MKTIYILLTRSGTLLSKLVYAVTGASYTHASMAFDEELNCLYSSTRKNGYTMFPAGPSKEYLNRGVFRLRAVCAGSHRRGLRPRPPPCRAHDGAGRIVPLQHTGADLVCTAYPLAAPPALFLLPVRQRGAGKERRDGAA